jgi:DNA-binding winged helix-turn-helix (wHTH) protein
MAERVLLREGKAVPLRPKLFELLIFLIERRGEILEKDEIAKAVWGEVYLGSVEKPDANLNVNISHLRHALGDDPDNPIFIETIPRRGYRFITLVRVSGEPQSKLAEARLSAAGGAGASVGLYASEPLNLVTAWPEPATGGGFDIQPQARDEDAFSNHRKEEHEAMHRADVPAIARQHPRKMMFTAVSLISVIALLGWVIVKPGSSRQGEDRSAPPTESESPRFRPRNKTTITPQIDSIEPAIPSAWIGDKPIKVNGRGFHQGLSVTMLFPGGGSAALSGGQVLDVTAESFTLIADFNNNPGEYRIRVNSPGRTHSDWLVFDVLPVSLLPEIVEVKPRGIANGMQRIAVNGRNFLQSVSAVLIYPDGRTEYLQAMRVSANSFYLLFDSRGQAGPFKFQAQNSGKGSNVVSFSLSTQ